MTTTGLYSDVVLPAATWYEKYDLSMTDMHPFVHSFNQAVPPPWEARTDWDAFQRDRARVLRARPPSTSASGATSSPPRSLHDSPGEITQPRGEVPTGARASASRCPGARCRT